MRYTLMRIVRNVDEDGGTVDLHPTIEHNAIWFGEDEEYYMLTKTV